jgi:hypothetical protein
MTVLLDAIAPTEQVCKELKRAVGLAHELSEVLISASQGGISQTHSAHLAELGRKAELVSGCLKTISRSLK